MSEATTYEGAPEMCGVRFQEWKGDPLWPCLRVKGHDGPHAVQKDAAELFDTRAERDEAIRQRDELRSALRRYTDLVELTAEAYRERYGPIADYADAMDEFYRAAKALLGRDQAPAKEA